MFPSPSDYSTDPAERRKQITRDLALSLVLVMIEAARKDLAIAAVGGKSISHYQTCEKALANIFAAKDGYDEASAESQAVTAESPKQPIGEF